MLDQKTQAKQGFLVAATPFLDETAPVFVATDPPTGSTMEGLQLITFKIFMSDWNNNERTDLQGSLSDLHFKILSESLRFSFRIFMAVLRMLKKRTHMDKYSTKGYTWIRMQQVEA